LGFDKTGTLTLNKSIIESFILPSDIESYKETKKIEDIQD